MTEPSMDWQPIRVTIAADGRAAHVRLDGEDISEQIAGYTVQQKAGELPTVALYPHPTAGARFDGLAHVVVGDQPDPGQLIADFLTSLDPKTLEQAALNRDDLGDERYALTQAMLQQAADWAIRKVT